MRSSPGSISIHEGAKVVCADGKELGTVKKAKADRFKVAVRMAPDYWLGTEMVDNTSDELVQLFITKEAVGSARLHGYDKVETGDLAGRGPIPPGGL